MSLGQTSYSATFGKAFPGMLARPGSSEKISLLNSSGGDIPAGIMVTETAEGVAGLPSSALAKFAGISMNSFARLPDDLTGVNAIKSGAVFNCVESGAIHVQAEETVVVGDDVYVRITSDGGSNTQLGTFRNDGDSGRCVKLEGARWVKGGGTTSSPALFWSRTAQQVNAEPVEFVINNASVSATTTTTELVTRADRYLVIDGVNYYNATGLAADASNYFQIQLKNGSTVLATWSTLTGQEGALTADTVVTETLNATPANLVVAPGSTLKLVLTKTGTQTLPAGKMLVHAHYV